MRRYFALLVVVLALFPAPALVRASDHADPSLPSEFDPELAKEPNITGLFVFPDGDQLVFILTVYKSLNSSPPYNFEDYEFVINMDLHSKINYDDDGVRARYGGHVVHPEGIKPDASITLTLNNQAELVGKNVEGITNPENIRWYSGVRDDPFIFTPFFGVNVVAMAMSIPISSFPEGQQDWISWGISRKKGSSKILDIVGRGLRTQLPRFGFINTSPPNEHLKKIEKVAHGGMSIEQFIMVYLAPVTNLWDYLLAIRYYDLEPDVCIFSTRYESRYPNGRRLEDDIAGIACDFGDCILVELSIMGDKTKALPRPKVNDKEFSSEFPYLADPWPNKAPTPGRKRLLAPQTVVKLVIGLILLLFLTNIIVLIRCWKRGRKAS